jgi:tetratricopeptide (TPR) repeat protein
MSSQTQVSQLSDIAFKGEIDLAPEIRGRLRRLIDDLPSQPSRLRVLGHVLLDLGLGALALNAFGRALLLDDLDASTHLGLTRVYIQTGQRDIGLEHLEIAISLRPDARELRVLAADLLGCRDKMRALDQLGKVLAAEPDHSGARKGLANLVRGVIVGRLQAKRDIVIRERPEPVVDHSQFVWGDAEPFADLVQSRVGRARYVS